MAPLFVGMAVGVASCDEDTAFIGSSIMPGKDNVSTSQAEYNVYSRSVKVDSVLANTNDSYLGCIIDPETRAKTTCGFLAQFHVMEDYQLPEKSRMVLDLNGNVVADSCEIRISFDKYYGDSLATMKLFVNELDTNNVIRENVSYYTNMDPKQFVSANGVKTAVAYALKDLSRPDNETDGVQFYRNVVVRLPKEYGSFLMNKYYENPKFYKNSYEFIHHVCAGFQFETVGSIGSMLRANVTTMDVYFRYRSKTAAGNDTIVVGMQRMAATEEVIQNTYVENKLSDDMLRPDQDFTYVKSPTGIFTEVTLPVADIVGGEHRNDTINSAKIAFRRYNTGADHSFQLSAPSSLLMVRSSIAREFFEKNRLPENNDSYISEFNSLAQSYVFSNISQMITVMKLERDKGAGVQPADSEEVRQAKYEAWEQQHSDWNKVMLIPVKAEYTLVTDIYGMATKKLMQVRHEMGLNSAQLEGGKSNSLKMEVVYSRFNH